MSRMEKILRGMIQACCNVISAWRFIIDLTSLTKIRSLDNILGNKKVFEFDVMNKVGNGVMHVCKTLKDLEAQVSDLSFGKRDLFCVSYDCRYCFLPFDLEHGLHESNVEIRLIASGLADGNNEEKSTPGNSGNR
ncbi:hypothetical protein L6452_09413 [Arctium lappa]|uniref:Uncharacterized protein n=1 Tax=Arctium lappa TaxID=4217 RepID=A0ACB9DKE8_ARCLA|nr:hypothetical protein L6452_09413 [Arctium lappa]